MKKILSLTLALAMLILVFAGCGEESNVAKKITSIDDIETLGDIFDMEGEGNQKAYYEGKAVYVFELDGVYYRAVAKLSKETEQAVFDIDITKDGHEEKEKELVKDIKIDKIENLEEYKLSQEELDALKGKTGAELLDEGWLNSSGYNLGDMEFWMDYGPFTYSVFFDGKVEEADYDDFDADEGIKELVVKSAEYNSIGQGATDIETED